MCKEVSIFAFIPMLLQAFKIDILPANYHELINMLLGILVVAGILNDPNSGEWFSDLPQDGAPLNNDRKNNV
jgi:uncharacterized membrane protein